MQIADLMLRDTTLVPAEESVQGAAQAIADLDSRFIFVGSNDHAVGILTIRDIIVRVVAAGLDPAATPVSQVMSASLFTCNEQDTADTVVNRMSEHRIEQMPVLDASDCVIGVITRHAAQTLSPSGAGA